MMFTQMCVNQTSTMIRKDAVLHDRVNIGGSFVLFSFRKLNLKIFWEAHSSKMHHSTLFQERLQ